MLGAVLLRRWLVNVATRSPCASALQLVLHQKIEPTTTKWLDHVKEEERYEFVRCQVVVFMPRHEGLRDDLCAAMPPFEDSQSEKNPRGERNEAHVRGRERRRCDEEERVGKYASF